MSVGDVVGDIITYTGNDSNDIRPDINKEWSIHNIYYEGSFDIYISDGVNSVKIDNVSGYGCINFAIFHLSNAQYMTITEVDGSTGKIAYDGIITKED